MFRLAAILITIPLMAQQADQHSPPSTPADIAAGAKTFRSHCAPCHGYNGEGGRGPNLAAGRFYHGSSDLDLFNNITNGIPGTEMPGNFYSAVRIWQVVAYIRSLSANSEKATGDAQRGAKLYDAQGCAGCHRIDGSGSGLGPDLSQIGAARSLEHLRLAIVDPSADVQPRYWRATFEDSNGKTISGFLMNEDTYTVQTMDMNQQLHTYEKAGAANYRIEKKSAMPAYTSLSASEVNDLVAYLATRRPQ
jgi:putative heme-binding domain-containing protein